MPKTKIFLSSASQPSFSHTRNTSFEKLRLLGHDPLMFERNFGAWHNGEDSISRCIRMVSECDIFILFIGERAGSITSYGRSVTHLEFEQALAEGKPVLVFVEPDIKAEYLGNMKYVIDDYIATSRSGGSGKPASNEIVRFIATNKPRISPSQQHVDDYVWYFLHEIMAEEKIFVENLLPGVQIDWETLLSDMLRDGVEMLRNKKDIVRTLVQTKELQHYKKSMSHIIPFLRVGSESDLPHLLAAFKNSALGNTIVNDFGYVQRKIGVIGDCSAVTLYKQEQNKMMFIAASGEVTAKSYNMDDDTSFVVLTQKSGNDNISFREDNNSLYVCLKGNDFVVTFHFPCGEEWNSEMYLDYRSHVESGIMLKNGVFFNTVVSILEGVI
ncbi:DUF4062 domain-containing protein [Paenibacillus cymbidii]|uniref:DUF4062 domain-containing protein n=1 Tax=Paenibacillus cymbidii TaxID=1639034 RepID=UPI001436AEB4|nr:DUF4062 domain-containing protein [Paenibacillus cymbidii]